MTKNRKNKRTIAIILGSGKWVAVIDREDKDKVSMICWHAHKGNSTWYARGLVDGKRVLLHVFIMGGKKKGYTIDHINGNGLDNRRCNLRWATQSQQSRNKHVGRGRSVYKGVSWASRQRKWAVSIYLNGKNKHVGYFNTENDAAKAYDKVALKYYGEFACVNFCDAEE